MKKKVVSLWYTISRDQTRGIIAVDFPIGFTDVNEYSRRFSDRKNKIVVQFAVITKGFTILGSQNNQPLPEKDLRFYAELLIKLVSGSDGVIIEWSNHDFLAARHTGKRRDRPWFNSTRTTPVLPVTTYAATLERELKGIQATI